MDLKIPSLNLLHIIIWLSPLFPTLVYTSAVQFCRVDSQQGTDQCLALSSYNNESSNANDFYLLLSAKFEQRAGFAAFGTGPTMDGALMFVFYPGKNDGGALTWNMIIIFHSC